MKIHLPKRLSTALIISLGLLVVSATSVQAATFSLSPASGSTVSGTFTVTLGLTDLAGKQVSAIDVYLNYEPSKLEAQSISVSSGIFNDYPVKTIDSTNGRIAISAHGSTLAPVTTSGTIATITFKAKQTSGTTNLSFDYVSTTPPTTTDSNIVEAGTATELLTQPPTVTYNFGTTTTPPPTTPPPTTPPPTTPPAGNGAAKGAPEGGVTEPTVLVSFLSMTMVGVGLALRIKRRTALSFEEKILNRL